MRNRLNIQALLLTSKMSQHFAKHHLQFFVLPLQFVQGRRVQAGQHLGVERVSVALRSAYQLGVQTGRHADRGLYMVLLFWLL